MDDRGLRDMLLRLDPPARDAIRRVLIADDPYRNAMAERLLRQRTEHAARLGDLFDLLTINSDARRQAVRILGELGAEP
jgi:hypothetical protein